MTALLTPAATASHGDTGDPGDETIRLHINDSAAGGTYLQEFEREYAGETGDGTPVYIYLPAGWESGKVQGVDSLDPDFDPNPSDSSEPCADRADASYKITQQQIDYLGNELTNQIVQADEAHFGPMGDATPNVENDNGDALVTLVYNVQDDFYYDCSVTSYTAGYFAPGYIEDAGMNVIVSDALDWGSSLGDDAAEPNLYEGVIAHELEHLLHNYSDQGELSWVDEGLADFAGFLNGYDVGGSHLTYHQVFHRETSLTRWAGLLRNYGASYTYFQYLWEQAGGNGDGTYTPDQEYDGAAGDLLIKKIFQQQANSVAGVQAGIDAFNAATDSNLRSARELFQDWAVAVRLDDEDSARFDIKAADFGAPEDTSWTIRMANQEFFNGRAQYQGAMPNARWKHNKNVPDQTALPFGTAYSHFRNPGPAFKAILNGADATQIPPHSGETHWYGGHESQSDKVLDVATDGSVSSVDFWTRYFIEQGWDYGFVEALVNGEWQTVPLVNDAGEVVTTDEDPHGNNTEGNGITGTSGGTYLTDRPEYLHLTAQIPEGATDVRFRYSTDAAYLNTGWFVDDVMVDGAPAQPSSDAGEWFETDGVQDNDWTLQLLSSCDLTPDEMSDFEITDNAGNHVYRLEGDDIAQAGFDTKCHNGTKEGITSVVSNLPAGDLVVLNADYKFRLYNTGRGSKS